MKLIKVLFFWFVLSLPAYGQAVTVTASAIRSAPSAPSNCSPNSVRAVNGALYLGKNDGTCQLIGSDAGTVIGPGSATDNAVVRFDGTTGALVQNSAVTIADTTGDITGGKYNKVTVTAPATGATLTLAEGSSLITAGAFTATITSTATTNSTLPAGTHSLAPLDSPSFTTPNIGAATGTSLTTTGAIITSAAYMQVASAGGYLWASRSQILSPADGVLRITSATGTDFDRLQFGSTTSSFPALKRSSAVLEARLADDSAYTSMRALAYSVNNACVIRSGSGTPESAVVGNVCDLYLRTDGGTATTLYVKESGTGNTGWVGK